MRDGFMSAMRPLPLAIAALAALAASFTVQGAIAPISVLICILLAIPLMLLKVRPYPAIGLLVSLIAVGRGLTYFISKGVINV